MSITVPGRGAASGVADEVALEFEVGVRRGTATEALDGLTGALHVVFAVLEEGPAVGHATSGMALGIDHDRQGQPRGHRASQVVTTVVGVGEAGRVVADVVGAAGDDVAVRSLRQRSSDVVGLRARARAGAVADARARATEHADLAGRRLGPLLELVESADGGPPQPRQVMRAMAEPVPVAAGTDEVTVTLTATYGLD